MHDLSEMQILDSTSYLPSLNNQIDENKKGLFSNYPNHINLQLGQLRMPSDICQEIVSWYKLGYKTRRPPRMDVSYAQKLSDIGMNQGTPVRNFAPHSLLN